MVDMNDTDDCECYVAKIDDFDLKLKKVYSASGVKYCLKICCPQIVTLTNDCPRKMVSFKIPECFQSNNVMYRTTDEDATFALTNMTNGQSSLKVIRRDNCQLALILTDDVCKKNELCITEFTIPVTPYCLDCSQCYKVSVNELGVFVCLESNLKETILNYVNSLNTGDDVDAETVIDSVLEAELAIASASTDTDPLCREVLEALVGDVDSTSDNQSVCDVVGALETNNKSDCLMEIEMAVYDCTQ